MYTVKDTSQVPNNLEIVAGCKRRTKTQMTSREDGGSRNPH